MHSYNTRYSAQQNFHRPAARTNYGIFTFKFMASKIWETIPLRLKQLQSLNNFKNEYKKHLLMQQ